MIYSLLDAAAREAAPFAGVAMLVLALAVLIARRPGPAVALVAAQAACLAVAALAQAWLQGSWEFAAIAAGTLAVKAVAMPRGWRILAPALEDPPGRAPPGLAVVAVALAVLVLALAAPAVGPVFGIALAAVLASGLGAALRRDAAGRAASLLALENALVLALVAGPAFPGVAALALATLALPAATAAALLPRLLAGARP